VSKIHDQIKHYLETQLDTHIRDLRVKLTSHPQKDNLLDYTTATVETKISGAALKNEFPDLHNILQTVCSRIFSLLNIPVLEEITLELYKEETRTYFVYTLDEQLPALHSLLNSSTNGNLSATEIKNSSILILWANPDSEFRKTTIETENDNVITLRGTTNVTFYKTIHQLVSNYIYQHNQTKLTSQLVEFHIEINQNPHFYIQTTSYKNPFPKGDNIFNISYQ
jgi:hypothetical protein